MSENQVCKTKTPTWKKLGVEATGTFVVMLAHFLAAGLFGSTGPFAGVVVGAIQGLSVYHAGCYFFRSGPFLNFIAAILALIFGVSPRLKTLTLALYILVELGFAVLAGLIAQLLLGALSIPLINTVPIVNGSIGVGIGFFVEFLVTFVSLLTFLVGAKEFEAVQTQNNPALAAGFTHAILVAIAFNFTGGCINPVRHFGVAILTPTLAFTSTSWIYYVAPVAAAVAALGFYLLFFKKTVVVRA